MLTEFESEFGLEFGPDVTSPTNGITNITIVKPVAPGMLDDEYPVTFRCGKDSIFSCRPVDANIKYLIRYFNGVYEGSETEKLIRSLLTTNQMDYFENTLYPM